jgi:uncharacterized protein YecE (DUF72 family)
VGRLFANATMQAGTVSHSAPQGGVRVGCSGWNYKHWREIFYPKGLPVSRWFAFYAEHFDTVEINNSFYMLPKPETFEKWRDQAPPGFVYAVKANRFITQAKKLLDCQEPLDRMMPAVRRLGDRLGPLLYQLPPSLKFNPERLESFLKIVPRDVVNVFEFRDRSWHVEETFDLLERYDASFCVHDMAGSVSERIAVGPAAYVRFHGGQGKYWGRYADERLIGWADWLAGQARSGRSAWAYFNNDIFGHALEDALTLKSMVGQSRAMDFAT